MGSLVLCKYPIAKEPYYIEEISFNIYSLEELCYVIEHYSYLIEETFFNQELLSWIEQVIGALELAEQLQNGLQEDLSSVELVEMILNATGYLSYEKSRNVLANIHQMQHMTMSFCMLPQTSMYPSMEAMAFPFPNYNWTVPNMYGRTSRSYPLRTIILPAIASFLPFPLS